MAKIDPRLVELLKSYGETAEACWDCHGTWVAYHAAIERMAAKASIKFDMPQMIVNEPEKKTVVICVSASMGQQSEWSFGEVSPANNKNSYPYAMAEKRAKDRVALKLLGMAGLVYSEEEADDFKAAKPSNASTQDHAPVAKKQPAPSTANTDPKPMSEAETNLWAELAEIKSLRGLQTFWGDNAGNLAKMDKHTQSQFIAMKESLKKTFDDASNSVLNAG